MLQPHNAAVFCWPGAMQPYRYKLRKRRVEERKNLTAVYFFCHWRRHPSACVHHGRDGTPLPFTLHHHWWHRSVHLPAAGGHGNHQRRDVKNLLKEYVMEEKESHPAYCIAKVQESPVKDRNRVLWFISLLRLLVKKFVWKKAVIASMSEQTRKETSNFYNTKCKSSFLASETVVEQISSQGSLMAFAIASSVRS